MNNTTFFYSFVFFSFVKSSFYWNESNFILIFITKKKVICQFGVFLFYRLLICIKKNMIVGPPSSKDFYWRIKVRLELLVNESYWSLSELFLLQK